MSSVWNEFHRLETIMNRVIAHIGEKPINQSLRKEFLI